MVSTAVSTQFAQLLDEIHSFPLWIRQVIYIQLREELERMLTPSTLNAFGHDDMLQLHRPKLIRQMNLSTLEGGISPALKQLLPLAAQQKTVAEICIIHHWSLEACAKTILEAIEKGVIERPRSPRIDGTIEYLAGKTRLGEYLIKIDRLTAEQLDQSLRTQRYILEAMGNKTGLANVLINLGYINRQDVEGILFLKEESKKPFHGFSTETFRL